MLLHGLKQEERREMPYVLQYAVQQHYEQQARLKRTREDNVHDYGQHKDDNKGGAAWQQTALEHPSPVSSTSTSPWSQSQQRASLLPDPEVIIVNPPTKQDQADPTTRLPSIKHLELDPRSRRWDYGTDTPSSHPHSYSPYPTPQQQKPQQKRSPLKVTQAISPPPSPSPQSQSQPQPQATELVQVKTNTYGFIETTFANVPAKKVILSFFSSLLHLHLCFVY